MSTIRIPNKYSERNKTESDCLRTKFYEVLVSKGTDKVTVTATQLKLDLPPISGYFGRPRLSRQPDHRLEVYQPSWYESISYEDKIKLAIKRCTDYCERENAKIVACDNFDLTALINEAL